VAGYSNLLEVLAEPSQDEPAEAPESVGEDFDPDIFDPDIFDPDIFDPSGVSADLAHLRRLKRGRWVAGRRTRSVGCAPEVPLVLCVLPRGFRLAALGRPPTPASPPPDPSPSAYGRTPAASSSTDQARPSFPDDSRIASGARRSRPAF